MVHKKQFQAGEDAEFYRILETIDDIAGAETTDLLLSELGLNRGATNPGEGISQNSAAARIGVLVQQRLGISGIAFDVSERCYATADLGVYGNAMLSAGTIGGMLHIGLDYNRIYAPNDGYQIVQRENEVALQFYVRGVVGAQRTLQLELAMAASWQYMKQLRPQVAGGELRQVNLSYPEPGHHQRYRSYYLAPVAFDQPFTELIFAKDFLSLPIGTGSIVANELLAEQSNRLYRRLNREAGIVDAVRQEILQGIGQQWPELDQVASGLALSGRTLRRRLREHGHSYKQISNEIRMTLAREYLEHTSLSNEEISSLLGYAESPAFYRAYRSWYGVSPGQSRKALSS